MIPKIIHQIWFQDSSDIVLFSNNLNKNFKRIFKSDIPFEYKYNLIKLLIHNSDYSYCLWNKTKIYILIKLFYPKILHIYSNLKYKIQKIDFAKYIILYHYGGIYIDIDIESNKGLNYFFKIYKKDGLYFSKTDYINNFENNIMKKFYDFQTDNYFINNGIMIANKKHPFFLNLLNEVDTNNKNNKDYLYNSKVFNISGPSLLTNSILKNKNKYNNIYIINNKYFEPCYGKDITCKLEKDNILVHKHKSAWIENIETNNSFIKFLFNTFFSITIDGLTSYYFMYLRGYKIVYFILLFIIYNYNKKISIKYT